MTLEQSRRDADALQLLANAVGERLRERTDEISQDITDRLAGIEQLASDPGLHRLLGASVASNVATIMGIFNGTVDIEKFSLPPAAIAYAERLAQRGISANRLVRAYHMGQDQLKHFVFEEAESLEVAPEDKLRVVQAMIDQFYRYIDTVTVAILDIHEAEQRRWNQATGNVASVAIHSVLAGNEPPPNFAAETGIVLDQFHVGLVLWSDSDDGASLDRAAAGSDAGSLMRALEQASRALAARIGTGPPVFSAVDPTTAWVWIPRARRDDSPGLSVVEDVMRSVPDGRASVGLPARGLAGFRRTHVQALAARGLALAGDAAVTGYGDPGVAVVSMLARDRAELAVWVAEALGGLAVDTEANARLRETLLVHLELGGGVTATSERLVMHRNSVRYRLTRAAEVRGLDLDVNRLDLELALTCVRLLGPALLRPADPTT